MKQTISTFLFISILLTACTSIRMPPPTATQLPTPLQVTLPANSLQNTQPAATPTPTRIASLAGVNPLTGLKATKPELLNRRPVVVKVQNVPRVDRPQWGLSFADIVYEYYIEYGDTRFAAVFYGQQPAEVGPIRSARHIDIQIVTMYKAFLVFGGAYEALFDKLLESDFAKRLIREGPNTAPALHRYDPNGRNSLLVKMPLLDGVIQRYEMDNQPQDLAGMLFQKGMPQGGEAAPHLFVRFSGGMYNRWDYDKSSRKYLRFADAADDLNRDNPVYTQAVDRLTGKPLAFDNLVVIYAPYNQVGDAQVFDVNLIGSGQAFVAREGKIFSLKWQRKVPLDVLTVVNDDGSPFPLKPGQTWISVLGAASQNRQDGEGWHFNFVMP